MERKISVRGGIREIDYRFKTKEFEENYMVGCMIKKTDKEVIVRVRGAVADLAHVVIKHEKHKDLLERKLHTLTEREAEILRLRFGLRNDAHTFKSIGDKYHVSGQRISKIVTKILTKILRGDWDVKSKKRS